VAEVYIGMIVMDYQRDGEECGKEVVLKVMEMDRGRSRYEKWKIDVIIITITLKRSHLRLAQSTALLRDHSLRMMSRVS
jgi:hypothetical protein